jgi:hypothetical protein
MLRFGFDRLALHEQRHADMTVALAARRSANIGQGPATQFRID